MSTIIEHQRPSEEFEESRELARERVQARRDFVSHLIAYVVVNSFLVGVWALTGAGYFWPVWVIAGWGVGLILHLWDVSWRRPVTEADIDAELKREHSIGHLRG